MSLRIQSNPEAMNAHRQLIGTSDKLQKSMERLSSGYRINRAADDAAGLAISEKLRGQISGISQAMRNTQDAVSLVQTAEGALQRGPLDAAARPRAGRPVQERHAVDRTTAWRSSPRSTSCRTRSAASARQVQFNGVQLLDSNGPITFQVGAMDGEIITVSTVSLGSAVGADRVRAHVPRRHATSARSTRRSTTCRLSVREFGAVQNRLDHTLANLATYHENLVASESRVRDADMAAGDGELHQAPDPAAGRHLDAGSGQPGPAVGPDAAPRLALNRLNQQAATAPSPSRAAGPFAFRRRAGA